MEPIELTAIVLADRAASPSWQRTERIGRHLLDVLNTPDVLNRIEKTNRPGKNSAEIQEAFKAVARALGFQSEKTGLFNKQALLPDYYLDIGNDEAFCSRAFINPEKLRLVFQN